MPATTVADRALAGEADHEADHRRGREDAAGDRADLRDRRAAPRGCRRRRSSSNDRPPQHAVARRDGRVERSRLRDPPVDELRDHDRRRRPRSTAISSRCQKIGHRSVLFVPVDRFPACEAGLEADASTRRNLRRPASRAAPPRRRARPGSRAGRRRDPSRRRRAPRARSTHAATPLGEPLELRLRRVQVARGIAAAVAADRRTSSPCACSSSRMRARNATRRSATGRTSARALLASAGVNRRSARRRPS